MTTNHADTYLRLYPQELENGVEVAATTGLLRNREVGQFEVLGIALRGLFRPSAGHGAPRATRESNQEQDLSEAHLDTDTDEYLRCPNAEVQRMRPLFTTPATDNPDVR